MRPTMRVLVADDSRDAVQMLSMLLEDEGHQVHVVYRGDDVMPEMRNFKPHAVLLDIKMPGLNGFDLARLIRGRYGAEAPLLVALSGHFKKGADKVLADIAGFDHHFPKPYDPEAVLSLLRS